jgi:hypothetical protein
MDVSGHATVRKLASGGISWRSATEKFRFPCRHIFDDKGPGPKEPTKLTHTGPGKTGWIGAQKEAKG